MPIRTIKIDPPFTNPFPPTVELIKRFVKECHDTDEEVNVDIRQLSGGLSGAIVALVSHSDQRHVVKVDRQELVIKEISTYQNNLANIVDNSRKAKTKMALLDFPSAAIRQKGMDEVKQALICEKGHDNEEYAIHCYSYAKKDIAQESLWSFDAWINESIVSRVASNSMRDVNSLVSDLSDTLHDYFYDRQTEKRNFRKFELPAIPWGQFLPVACAAASFHPGWIEFVTLLPDVWQKLTAKQDTESINFYLSHGDLRCANIIVTMNSKKLQPFLIDFGLTAYEHSMFDFARLEADMVQRILLQYPEEEIQSVILKVTEAIEFSPDFWNNASKSHPFLQMVFIIRSHAAKQFKNIAENQRLNYYELFLLGHATRMIRNDDPALRSVNTRYLYLWFILRLFERVIRRYDPGCDLPELAYPIDSGIFRNVERWELKQLYHGSDERNEMKKTVIENDAGPIRLLAHTAHSYLDSKVKRFYNSFLTRLSRNRDNSIQIILLNPFSLEGSKLGIAEARGLLQGPEVDCEYHEECTEFFTRFRTCLSTYKEIKEKYPNIELRITHYSPDATVLLSDDNAFVEPYLIGNVYLRYHGELNMTVPEYLIPAGSKLYKVAEDQF